MHDSMSLLLCETTKRLQGDGSKVSWIIAAISESVQAYTHTHTRREDKANSPDPRAKWPHVSCYQQHVIRMPQVHKENGEERQRARVEGEVIMDVST